MKRILLYLLLTASALGQNRPVAFVETLADMDARRALPNEMIYVRKYSPTISWGEPKAFWWDSTNALATNEVRRAVVNGGRRVHEWNGDVRLFGADMSGSAFCNNALSNAWRVGRDLYFPQGRYLINNAATTDNEGRPCALFVEPPTDLASRLSGFQMRGDGTGRSVILMTNAGTGIRVCGTNYGGTTTASFNLFNVKFRDLTFEGDGVSVQTAVHMRYCGFNSRIDDIQTYKVKTEQDKFVWVVDNCWNLTSKSFQMFGGLITGNGLVITNANQQTWDYIFTQGFVSEYTNGLTTNGVGVLVLNPDGFKIANCQMGNKSAYGIRVLATTAAGNDGPTEIFGNSEGPMIPFSTDRDAGSTEYLDNLVVQMSGFTTGSGVTGGNLVRPAMEQLTNNYRHFIELKYARNVKLKSSFYDTRNEDFSTVVSNATGGAITSWINTNYCVWIDETCRDVIIEPSLYGASSLNQNVWDAQLRPTQQPNSWILHQEHTPSETYYATSGISGGSSVVSQSAYSYFREGINAERYLKPKAIELGVEAYVRTVGPITNGLVQMWAGNSYIRTNNSTMRRWLGWTATTNIIQGQTFRGQIMAPVDSDGNWEFQVFNPLGWETEWTIRPIGGIR
jgi:hypothetical protein